jgi:hypothetical protein
VSSEVAAALDVASGSLEVGSDARHALIELFYAMDAATLLALLRERGLWDAVGFVRWMSRVVDDHEAELQELQHQPPPVTVATVWRPRARERRSRTTKRTQRGSPDRLDDPDPPHLGLRRRA